MPAKKRASPPRRKGRKRKSAFWLDKVGGVLQIASGLCGVGFAALLFGVTRAADLEKLVRQLPAELVKAIGASLAALVLALSIALIVLGVGLFRSRTWALWLVLLLHAGSAGAAAALQGVSAQQGWSIAVAVYCALRLFAVIGPPPN